MTFVSMGVGAALLLLFGRCNPGIWAAHRAALADHRLVGAGQHRPGFHLVELFPAGAQAVESSILNSLMLPQIAILAYIFLQERLTLREMLGLGLVCLGVILVQLRVPLSKIRRLR